MLPCQSPAIATRPDPTRKRHGIAHLVRLSEGERVRGSRVMMVTWDTFGKGLLSDPN